MISHVFHEHSVSPSRVSWPFSFPSSSGSSLCLSPVFLRAIFLHPAVPSTKLRVPRGVRLLAMECYIPSFDRDVEMGKLIYCPFRV